MLETIIEAGQDRSFIAPAGARAQACHMRTHGPREPVALLVGTRGYGKALKRRQLMLETINNALSKLCLWPCSEVSRKQRFLAGDAKSRRSRTRYSDARRRWSMLQHPGVPSIYYFTTAFKAQLRYREPQGVLNRVYDGSDGIDAVALRQMSGRTRLNGWWLRI